jgi:hypothetical protein
MEVALIESSTAEIETHAARRTWRSRVSIAAPLAGIVLLLCSEAAAEPAADVAQAETLFQEAKELLKAKRYAEACPKLEESLRLDRATGTLIALAICHEGEGKSATAWTEFAEAVVAAQKNGRTDRIEFARDRARALSLQLSRLEVRVPPDVASVPGLQIKRDGVVLGTAVWSSSVPVDPGLHTIEASAPGMRAWASTVQIATHGDQQIVTVPLMERLEARPIEAPRREVSPRSGAAQRTAGWVVGGAGVAALGVGTYFGLRAISHHNQATDRCSPTFCTDPEAVRLNDDAKVSANISTVGVGLGIAGVALGSILVLTAPARRPDATKATLWIGPGTLGLRLTLL